MTIADLEAYGADTKEGLGRCLDNEDIYIRLVNMIPDDPRFNELYSSIEAGDLESAFDAAHALKGSTGNLALTPVYEPIYEITELLRARTEMDYSELVDKIRKGQEGLKKIAG